MKSVQNKVNAPLEVPGFPMFEPNEVREVSDEDADILAGSQNISVLTTPRGEDEAPKPAKKRISSDNS